MYSDEKVVPFGIGYTIAVLIGVSLGFLNGDLGLGLLGILGVFAAVGKYFYEKDKGHKAEIIGLVSYFRKEILPLQYKFVKEVEQTTKNKNKELVRIPLDCPTTEYVKKNYAKKALEQNQYVWIPASLELLNSTDEFSLRVRLLSAHDDQALSLIKYSFCQILENLAVRLLAERDMISGNDMYRNSLDLYTRWVTQIDRQESSLRLEKFKQKHRV